MSAETPPGVWRLTDDALREIRKSIRITREQYGFDWTMRRWAQILSEDERNATRPPDLREPLENESELVEELTGLPPCANEPVSPRRGRPRRDFERWAALLLAHIFYEFTRGKPARHNDPIPNDPGSPFYAFCFASGRAVNLRMPSEVLREISEQWERSINFRKGHIRQLLWGQLRKKR
jgi:hypothetical protein